jgi:hypothetical protein
VKKKTSKNKERKMETNSKFITTKNLSTNAKWLENRFMDLIKRIKKKKYAEEDTSKITLVMDDSEFESIIDGLERGMRIGFLLDENKKLKAEVNQLDRKLDDKAWNELLAIEWAKEAIPGKGIKLEDCKIALRRIGISTPGKGPPKKRNPIEVLEFHKMVIIKLVKINKRKKLSTKQKETAVESVLAYLPFEFPSYDATRKYLTRHKANNLPWGE